ncbi:MAG: WYL domain-containing protein [Chloroflexi bacterium]|nr:WYL domain-containing protein [Chloroflexota bacterium]
MPTESKKDRTARLLRVEHLLYQTPRGLKAREIAYLCGVNVRTTYRDLRALDFELKIPVWQDDDGRYGIMPGYFLPPIHFTLSEAMTFYLSARLVARYADERDPNSESAFTKLASVLPPPISDHVRETVALLADHPDNPTFTRVLDILTVAWARRRRVRIWYRWPRPDGAVRKGDERLLDPYFIEPSGTGHSCYVIGFDHYSNEVRTFKVERIRDIELTGDEYGVPDNWKARDYLKASWGISHDVEVEIHLRFSRAVASRVKESIWHPSQRLADDSDGTLLFSVRVAGILEITPWILSWGDEVEVLSPAELRNHIGEIAQRHAALYLMARPPIALEKA